jgi:hypothetical protein
MIITNPEYRTILAADIAGSAGRGDKALLRIREVLFTALHEAMERSEIDWAACQQQDTGDGVMLIMPPGVRKPRLIHPLGYELAAHLRAHNRTAAPLMQVQVRLVLHAGDIHIDPQGTAIGHPLEVVARLLDAPPAREELGHDGVAVPLVVITSQHFYDEIVPHGYPGIERESFRKVAVTVKEYAADAWLWLPPASGARPAANLGVSSRDARRATSAVTEAARDQPVVSVGRDLSGAVVIGNGSSAQVRRTAQRHPGTC